MRITPAVELEHRCKRLQELMAEQSLDAVLVLQNADLFYFAGTTQSGCLYVPCAGQPLYMVRRDAARARMESGLKEVHPFSSMKEAPVIAGRFGYAAPQRIGMELDVIPVGLYERYRKVYPGAEFVDATPLIRRVRAIKSQYEIHIMQDCAEQVDKVYRRACEVIRPGMSDIELAAELEYVARREGHQGFIRMRGFNGEMMFGHTFSGTDTAVAAYTDTPFGGIGPNPSFGQGASWKHIERNDVVIIDFAGNFDGYLVDQTRLFAVGSISDKLMKGYEDMLRVQQRMREIACPGATWGGIYEECAALAAELGYADSFMGRKGAQVSFIGHGLGIEIDEYPFIARGFDDQVLEVGMAFAFEPKVVFPGEGAAGIENTFYLSGDGLKQLTFSPEEIAVVGV